MRGREMDIRVPSRKTMNARKQRERKSIQKRKSLLVFGDGGGFSSSSFMVLGRKWWVEDEVDDKDVFI